MRVYRYLIVAAAVLCVGLALHATGALHVESGTWIAGPSMNTPRTGAASVLMPDGRVLVTGGSDASGNATASAEFVNSDGSISDAPQMGSARSGHSAVWLPTGYVLVAGGKTSGGGATNSAELFDPLSNQWTTLPSTMVEARTDFTATVLRFGNVVIAGGNHAGVPVSSVELFDVSSESFSSIGALSSARKDAAAAAISDFKVLIAGGTDANGATLGSSEIIDTESGTISDGPSMNSPRHSASATVLLDGRVLIAGGSYPEGADANGGVAELASTDIYDPTAGTMAAGPSLSAARSEHQAFLLPNNNGVLLVGGVSAGQELASTDLYSGGSFTAQASMSAARKQGTGSALQNPAFGGGVDGVLLVAGGSNQASSEFYGFATVKTDKDDYAPGTPVIITGSGWVPGETVSLSLLESPALDTHTLSSVVADANGNIYSDEFAPDAQDMGIRFYLTAAGSKSVAQSAFKDATNTATAIASNLNPSNINQSVTFTATVTAGTVPVTVGSVKFYNQTGLINPNCTGQTGTQIGSTQSLSALGKASVTTSFAAAGAVPVGACYLGTGGGSGTQDSNASLTQTVIAKSNPTFTGLLAGTTTYGDSSVTLGGSFSNTPKPTGSVNITVNGVTQPATINGSGNFSSTFNPSTFASNVAGYTITYSYAGDASYNSASDVSKKLIVGKAPLTITADDKSMAFGASVPALTYTPTGFKNSETASVLTGAPVLSTTGTSSSPVGNYPITAAAGTLAAANYSFTFVNGTLAIGKADVTIAWSTVSASYDATPHAITATPSPAAAALTITYTDGVSYNSTTAPTNAGNYTATATLTDTTNYKFAAAAQTTSPFTIAKVDPTVTAVGGAFTYDTLAKTGSGTATGVGGASLSPVTLSYQDSAHAAIPDAPINAGSYYVVAHFAGNGNYNAKDSSPVALVINKATPVVHVANVSATYDGNAHPAVGTVTGVNDAALGAATIAYTPGGATDPIDAGTYQVVASYAGSANYEAATANATVTIDKANSTTVVTFEAGPYVYRGSAFTATALATGAGGLNQSVAPDYSGDCLNVSVANGCTATANFAGDKNHNPSSDSKSITLLKATATVQVSGYTGTYDAAAHGASGSATGVGSTDLSASLHLGATFTDVPGGTAHWTFTGGTNYNDAAGDVLIVINKANAAVNVIGYTGVYDAAAHGASGSATGVNGANLSGGLNFGATFTDVPGGTAHWTFTGGTNYNDAAGDVAIVINKANATINVNGYTGVYDAAAHGASGTATGVNGANLSGGLNFGATFTDVPGGTAHWTFTGGTNYNDAAGDVSIVINKANAAVNVIGYTGVYDALAHGASGTATGVNGANLSGGLNLGATFTDVPGGTAHWTFTGGTNYNDVAGNVAIVINKANATINVNGYTGVYDAAAHGASGTATGVNGANLSGGLSFGAAFTNVPGGTAHWTFTGGTNYNDAAGDVAIVISKANAAVNVIGYTGVYDAAAHGASGTATGVNGANLSGGLSFGTKFTDVPGGTAHWTFTGGTNYNDAAGDVSIVISKANAAVNVIGYTGVYDAIAHGASGSATGVGGVPLSGLDLGATFTDVPGGTAHWTFTGGTNYNDAAGDVSIVISKANAAVNVIGYTGVYDALAHGASGTAKGIGGTDLEAGLGLGAKFKDAPGGTAHWTFAGGTNYNDAEGDVAIVISKADAVVSVTGYSGVYNAAPHGATGSATGVGGVALSGLDLGSSFTDVPGGTAHWTFTGGTNYNDQAGNVEITISKASSTTVVTCGGPVTFNGLAQTPCSVSVTGPGLNQTPAPTYSNNVNAGIATASYNYLGDGNLNESTDSKTFIIERALVTATAGSYAGVYDAVAHAPSACVVSGSYTGNLSCTNSPAMVGPDVSSGTVVPVTSGTGLAENFTVTPVSGTFTIDKAASVIAIDCPASVTYNGHAQTPCTASVTGVGGLNKVLSVAHSNNTNAGNATASASYGGDSNHLSSADSKNFTIDKANATISVTGYNVIFDNVAHTATGSAKGVLGETLSGLNLSGTTHTLVGTFNDSWSFTDGTGNYKSATGTVSDSIGKWTLSGFYQPVTTYTGTVIWNIVKGGSTVPVKFNIYAGTVQRTDVASVSGGSISLYRVDCATPGVDDALDEVVNTGSTMLRFDGSQFIQNWQTPKGAGQCFLVQMTALDGSKLQAYFKTK